MTPPRVVADLGVRGHPLREALEGVVNPFAERVEGH